MLRAAAETRAVRMRAATSITSRWLPGLFALGASLAAAACTPIGMAVGAGATAGVAAFQERPVGEAMSDAEIKLGLNDRLLRSEGLFSRISTRVMEGRVMLTGAVSEERDRDEAGRIAWTVPGVREVINEVEIADRSTLEALPGDEWIATKLRARLLTDFEISDINYSIDVVNGSIYILGLGRNPMEIDRVAAHARDISGVRRVVMHAIPIDDSRRLAVRPAGVPDPVPFERRAAGPRQGHMLAENQPREDLITGQLPLRADISAYEDRPAIETASVDQGRASGPRSLAPEPAGGIEARPLPPVR